MLMTTFFFDPFEELELNFNPENSINLIAIMKKFDELENSKIFFFNFWRFSIFQSVLSKFQMRLSNSFEQSKENLRFLNILTFTLI